VVRLIRGGQTILLLLLLPLLRLFGVERLDEADEGVGGLCTNVTL